MNTFAIHFSSDVVLRTNYMVQMWSYAQTRWFRCGLTHKLYCFTWCLMHKLYGSKTYNIAVAEKEQDNVIPTTPVVTLLGAWRYRVSAMTCWPGVSI